MPKINKVKVKTCIFIQIYVFFLRNVCFFYLQPCKLVGRMNQRSLISIKSNLLEQVSLFFFQIIKNKKILGAFGKVYKVFHKKSKLFYAIKEMDKNQLKSNDMSEQIINEVKIMYSLNHDNIIKLNNHFEDDKNVYLILEFASGVAKIP